LYRILEPSVETSVMLVADIILYSISWIIIYDKTIENAIAYKKSVNFNQSRARVSTVVAIKLI
jgi:hypothetical protein